MSLRKWSRQKKQRFCALVHGSARLDDHAIIGDVTHERTVQRRVHGLGRARIVDGYIHHPGWRRLFWSQRPKGHLRCISWPLGEREVRHGGLRPKCSPRVRGPVLGLRNDIESTAAAHVSLSLASHDQGWRHRANFRSHPPSPSYLPPRRSPAPAPNVPTSSGSLERSGLNVRRVQPSPIPWLIKPLYAQLAGLCAVC